MKKTAPYDKGTRLVDVVDLAILDFLMSRFTINSIHECSKKLRWYKGQLPYFDSVHFFLFIWPSINTD